jgi:glycosyltransferase involved in cell wall biosynthesis
MRILLLTTSPQMAGAEKMLFELALGLEARGFDVLVVTLKSEKDGQLLARLREGGIKTESLHMTGKWQIWKLGRFRRILKTFHPDILQSFLYFDNIVARVLGHLAKVPIILSGQRNARQQPKRRAWLDKTTMRFAHRIISNSSAGKEVLVQQYRIDPEKIHTILNGASQNTTTRPEAETLRLTQDKLHLGVVGHLTAQKGIHTLLYALANLRDSENTVCTIIGDGPEREGLLRLTHDLKIIHRVRLIGARENAAELMGAFDVLVLPSHYEGMPNVIMEAMAHGLPIIATDVGDVNKLVIHGITGFLVAPESEEELSKAIDDLLGTSRVERQFMGARGQKHLADNFQMDKMIDQFIQLYNELSS